MGRGRGNTGTEIVDRGGKEASEGQTEGGAGGADCFDVGFLRVVYLTLHNTFAYVVGALKNVCERVCVCVWKLLTGRREFL